VGEAKEREETTPSAWQGKYPTRSISQNDAGRLKSTEPDSGDEAGRKEECHADYNEDAEHTPNNSGGLLCAFFKQETHSVSYL
jgi:hypothetical protein